MLLRLFLAAAVLATATEAAAYSGAVVGITDGDTLTILDHRQRIRIRLAAIDAPERRQPYGQRARQSLADLCYGKEAEYLPETVDQYGRTVATVFCDGVDVSLAQLERGFAWVSPRYREDLNLLSLEHSARADRRGLWRGPRYVPPWVWRKREQKAREAGAD